MSASALLSIIEFDFPRGANQNQLWISGCGRTSREGERGRPS